MGVDGDVERAGLTLAELRAHGDVCVGCGRAAATSAQPILAAGVSLDALVDYVPAWPLCEVCRGRERVALRRARLAQVALGVGPTVVGLALGALGPLDHPIAPAVGVALGAGASWVAVGAVDRALARRLPVVVVSVAKEALFVLRASRSVAEERGGPYRATSTRAREAHGARVALGGGWAVLLGAAVLGVVAWFLTGALYPRVRFDNGSSAAMVVELDGGRRVEIPGRGVVETNLRHGAHVFQVRFADEVTRGERVAVTLPIGEPHLFAVDDEACFLRSSTRETRVHRGSTLSTVTVTNHEVCGRWIAIGAGDVTLVRTPNTPRF